MAAALKFDLSTNVPTLSDTSKYSDEMKKALPHAAASFLNSVAYEAKKQLDEEIILKLDKPNKFTSKTFGYKKAKRIDGQKMQSVLYANAKQSQYMEFPLFGGTREPGDAGPGKKVRPVFSNRPTKDGGAFELKRFRTLSQKAEIEKELRQKVRSGRLEAREAKARFNRATSFTAIARAKNVKGIFFGEVRGHYGIFERPNYRGKKQHLLLLMAFSKETKHPKLMDYDGRIAKAYDLKYNRENFEGELARVYAKYLTNAYEKSKGGRRIGAKDTKKRKNRYAN